MDRIEKFLRKLEQRMALKVAQALSDIIVLKLKDYDVKKMSGEDSMYRIRIGKIRIIFRKEEKSAIVISIDYRGGAY